MDSVLILILFQNLYCIAKNAIVHEKNHFSHFRSESK